MSRIPSVIWQELRLNFKRRSFLLLLLAVPLLAVAVVVGLSIFGGDENEEPENPLAEMAEIRVGYVDESGLFPEPLPSYQPLIAVYEAETAARADAESGELDAYYLIPADYLETGEVVRYAAEFAILEQDSGLFQSFMLNTLMAGEDPLLVARLQSPANVVEHQLDSSGTAVAELDEGSWDERYWLVYMYVMVLMMSSFLSAGQLTQSVVNEKENRMIEVVLSSLRPFELMAGKIIGQGIAGLVQIVVWLGSILFLINQSNVELGFLSAAEVSPGLAILMLVYFLGAYTLFAAFAAGIGAISKNMREGPQYAMIYSLPAVAPVMFLPISVNEPNSALVLFFSFFPMTAPLGMIQRLVLTSVPGWHVALSLLLLLLGIAGAMWLAGRLFRVNSLLSGELPGRKELMRLLFSRPVE